MGRWWGAEAAQLLFWGQFYKVTPGFSGSDLVAASRFFAVICGNVHVDDEVLSSWGIGLFSTVLS